jgi:hypothetical protein
MQSLTFRMRAAENATAQHHAATNNDPRAKIRDAISMPSVPIQLQSKAGQAARTQLFGCHASGARLRS